MKPFLTLFHVRFLSLIFLSGCALPAQGQLVIQSIFGSVDTVTVSNTTFANAGYLYNGINVSAEVTFTKNTLQQFDTVTAEMRVGFQLLDSSGTPVTLNLSSGTGPTLYDDDWEGDPDAGFPITIPALQPSRQETFTASLKPVAQLDPTENYTVNTIVYWREPLLGGSFFRWTIDDSLQSATQNFIHFAGTVSGDAALNVLSVLNSVTFTDQSAIAGASAPAAARAFHLNLNTTLHRWDNWLAARTTNAVNVVYDVELWLKDNVNGDQQIPLAQSQFTKTQSLYNYSINILQFPYETTVNHSIEIIPTTQLNSVDEFYYARVTVSHIEVPSIPLSKVGNTRSSSSTHLMHFNGRLVFSTFETRLEDFTNDPAASGSWSATFIQATLNGAEGCLTGSPAYTWGPASLTIRLDAAGFAHVVSPSGSVPVTLPSDPDIGTVAGVRFGRADLELDYTSGLVGTLTTYLPTGMSWMDKEDQNRASGTLVFANQNFNQSLLPAASSYTFSTGADMFVVEETKPLALQAVSIQWDVESGQVISNCTGQISYVREDELTALETAPLTSDQQFKRSNEQYYRAVGTLEATPVTVLPGPSGEALLTTAFSMGPGSFFTHFPYDVKITFSNGRMGLDHDLVDVAASHLDGAGDMEIQYNQACSSDACSTGLLSQNMRMNVSNGSFLFSSDGGLVAEGSVDTSGAPDTLAWGRIDSLATYHHQTSGFRDCSFHMPGHFVRGDQSTVTDPDHAPGVILYTGVRAADPSINERPTTTGYLEGQADYAGFNYRTMADGNVRSFSVIAARSVAFDLTGRCKYYIRPAGVTGIHEAVPGTFPREFALYGYSMTFNQYGLNYKMNLPFESRTEGSISLPYPSDFTQDFEEMLFTCLGGLDKAKVPRDGGDHTMSYWLANISVNLIDFASENACDPTADTFFLAGVTAEAAYIDVPLYGTLGFLPSGELMIPSSSSLNEDSRLYLPAVVRFDGPTKFTDPNNPSASSTEVYQLTPVSLAYYNDYAASSNRDPGDGKINFAGTLDVAFFEDLEVHMQTSARNVLPTQSVPIFLMGGWQDAAKKTFFNSTAFDPANKGFPVGVDEAVYRNETGNGGDPTPFLAHARQDWLGVVDFDYKLKWSTTTRSFESYEPETNDLVVITAEHKLEYLSANTAELSVGITYEGMPEVNLTNFVINEIDENTGVFQALLTEAKKPVVDAIEKGIDEMAEMLDDRMQVLYGNFLATTVEDEIVAPVFTQLRNAAVAGTYNAALYQAVLQNRIKTGSNSLQNLIGDLSEPVGDASYLFAQIDSRLAAIEIGIDAIIDGVWVDGAGNPVPKPETGAPDFSGFLSKTNGQFQILTPFIERLLAELAPDVSAELNALLAGAVEDLNARINSLLEETAPTLDQIIVILRDLRKLVSTVREAVAEGGQLINEMETILAQSSGEIGSLTTDIQNELLTFFATMPTPDDFLSYTEEEIKSRIRNEISDLFFSSSFVAEIQVTLKQYLYDVDASINEAISEAFAQVNTVIRDLISDALSGVDDRINGMLGDVNAIMGAGKLNGNALFNGDALRRLHIDLYLQLKIPDEIEFNGFLTIEQMDSEGDDSCSPGTPGGVVTEVKMGAIDVPADWISPDLRITVGTRFNFQSSPGFKLLGLGGSFELTSGEISFESFRITDMGAALMFGASENYIAAKLGLAFNSYEAFGGIYFGRTCSLDPLLLADKDVAEVLGQPNPTFTGVYMYGECHIPISEAVLGIPASCFFNITAGVGAGAFYFVEGNTLGGKIYAAVSGEALCIVSIKGEVTMIGLMTNGDLRFRGKGRLSGKVGWCPFCIKFGKSATISYQGGSWDVDL